MTLLWFLGAVASLGALGCLAVGVRGGRGLGLLGERLRSAPDGEVHEGRAAWGEPTADGVERLFLDRAAGRVEVAIHGAELLAIRPTRERAFEEGARLCVIGLVDEESNPPVVHASLGRPVVVMNLPRDRAGQWIRQTLWRVRPLALVSAALSIAAIVGAVLVARGLS
jgi:hypothetical protein